MATITGTSGNDVLIGTIGNDLIEGLAGNDILSGGLGNDILDGGDGDDRVAAQANVNFILTDTTLTGLGSDTLISVEKGILTGGDGNNTIDASGFTRGWVALNGGAGNDILIGGSGNDALTGGSGDDSLNGGTGSDMVIESGDVDFILTDNSLTGNGSDTLISIERATLTGGDSNNILDASAFTLGYAILNGEGGNDTLIGGLRKDILDGGDGDDTLTGGGGNDTINGGDGLDTLVESGDVNFTLADNGSNGNGANTLISIEKAILTGGAGNNILDASLFTLGSVTLDGGAGNDSIVGSSKNDTLIGGDGDDRFTGGLGNDSINGGSGIDIIEESKDVNFTLTDTTLTGLGSDTLSSIEFASLTGGAGNNTIDASGFMGKVVLNGGTGNDILAGGADNDILYGGAGDDIINGGAGNYDNLYGGDGNDTLDGQSGNDFLYGGRGNDIINGGEGDDYILGEEGNDTLDGGKDDDILFGGMDDDTLFGGDGIDTLDGGGGNDIINGGAGNDTVVDSGNDFTLTNSSLVGNGTDALVGIENAILTGKFFDDTLDASTFTLGSVTLNGSEGNDSLTGGAGDDRLDGGRYGKDTVKESGDVDFILTDNSLIGNGTDTLISIEQAILTSGESNNTLNASGFTLGSVTLNGGGDNDTLTGGLGNDIINGGDGIDTLVESGNDFTLTNGSLVGNGTDTLVGIENGILTGASIDASTFTLGAVTFVGYYLLGGAGNDTLYAADYGGGNGLEGGPGNDTLYGGDGFEYLYGGDDDDIIYGGGGYDYLVGEAGNDDLDGGDGSDTLIGGDGNDYIDGGDGFDNLYEPGDVDFTLTNSSLTGLGTDTLINIESAHLIGGDSNNILDASACNLSNVWLEGGGGNDTLLGGASGGTLDGGGGNDTLLGGDGNDFLAGEDGNDYLDGGAGNDYLDGGAGNDYLDGGAGTDIVKASGNVDFTLTDSSLTGLGTDTLSTIESAVLTGGVGNNSFNALAFTLGSVTQNGDAGNDELRGGFKNDFLSGGDGNDVLRGAGNNNGVGSIDTLTGNAGNDSFILSDNTTAFYNDGDNANAGLDDYALITDFNSAQDKIQLKGSASLYVLGASPIAGITGTSIFLDTNNNGAFNSTDELIAVLQGASGLSLASSYFTYV